MQQVSKQLIKGLPRRIALMLLDCGLIVLCYWLAVMLRFDSGDAYRRVEILRAMAPMLLYVLPIYMIVFWFGGLYEIMWEYAGMRDLARLTCLSGLATGIIMLFDLFYHSRPISGAVLIFGAVFNTAAIAGVRFLWRLVLTMRNAKANKPEDNTPLLIVGAGNAGAWAVNLCKKKSELRQPGLHGGRRPNQKGPARAGRTGARHDLRHTGVGAQISYSRDRHRHHDGQG